jgi:MarR family transcriptional regulator, organic hydroperoxide resistance regulator
MMQPKASSRSKAGSSTRSSAPDFPLSPALDFLQRLWQLNHALEQLSSQMEKRIGVTAPQRMIIRCIGKYPGMAPSQLATVLHLDPGTISATLSRLEDKGFVVRRRDRDDGRRVSLGLTPKGRRLDQPVRGTVENGMERLLAGAIPRDIAATRKLLEQLTGVLQDELETRPRAASPSAKPAKPQKPQKPAKPQKPQKPQKPAKPQKPR